jgi:hypothetical protein
LVALKLLLQEKHLLLLLLKLLLKRPLYSKLKCGHPPVLSLYFDSRGLGRGKLLIKFLGL